MLNQLCLVHTINMLLGERAISKTTLDEVCERLTEKSWLNPHRSPLGLGNYDANVAICALQPFGLEVSFADLRSPLDANTLALANTNLLVNTAGSRFIPGSRHWFAYRYYEGNWFRLDAGKGGPIWVEAMDEAIQSHAAQGDYILTVRPDT